jgi:hypothetical protein
MAFLPQVYSVPSFVTGASITSSLELPGSYLYLYLVVPTMSAGYSAASTPIYVQASADNSTFYRYVNVESNTNTVGANDFIIVSSTSQRMINITNFAFRYVRFEISGTCTTPASATPFKLVAVSNQ